jgi:Rrf2 family protein
MIFPIPMAAAPERLQCLGMSEKSLRRDNAMKRSNSSMQLTRAADYAVRVMIHLAALHADERVSLPSLAGATGAPESFLSKVLQTLARGGLISSHRGQAGGFHITPRGSAASMRDVIEAIDGSICLNVCLIHGRSCPRKATCPAHPVWARAQHAMLEVLANASIAAMAEESSAGKPRHSVSGTHSLHMPARSASR